MGIEIYIDVRIVLLKKLADVCIYNIALEDMMREDNMRVEMVDRWARVLVQYFYVFYVEMNMILLGGRDSGQASFFFSKYFVCANVDILTKYTLRSIPQVCCLG